MDHDALKAQYKSSDSDLSFLNFHYGDDEIDGNKLFERARKFYGYLCTKNVGKRSQRLRETDVDMPEYIFPYLLGFSPIFPKADYDTKNLETGAKGKTRGDVEDVLRHHLEALDKYHIDEEESAPSRKSASVIVEQAPITVSAAAEWLAENAADLSQQDCMEVLDALMKSPSLQGLEGQTFWAFMLDQALSELASVFNPQQAPATPHSLSDKVADFPAFATKLLRAGLQTNFASLPSLSDVQGAALNDLANILDTLNRLVARKEEEVRAALNKINVTHRNRKLSDETKQQKVNLKAASTALGDYVKEFGHSTNSMKQLAQEAFQGRLAPVHLKEQTQVRKQGVLLPKKEIKGQR
jgi:hypothetical protein